MAFRVSDRITFCIFKRSANKILTGQREYINTSLQLSIWPKRTEEDSLAQVLDALTSFKTRLKLPSASALLLLLPQAL